MQERHWGVGSVHAKKMKPGKVKNLKDRLLGAVQHTAESNLIEVGTGERVLSFFINITAVY